MCVPRENANEANCGAKHWWSWKGGLGGFGGLLDSFGPDNPFSKIFKCGDYNQMRTDLMLSGGRACP